MTTLVELYGWETLAEKIPINCFRINPSIKSSLTFLRKTEWARKKVEHLYLQTLKTKKQPHPASPLRGGAECNEAEGSIQKQLK